jgi:transglutaminase-like putative cysteine protease
VSRPLETLARDVTASIAFGAVAVSGSVPGPVLLAFPVALGLSLRGVRPLAGRRSASVVLLLAVAAALFGWATFGRLELIVAAVAFAVLVNCHRLVAEPSPQTTRQVLLTSLLVITGGAVLVGDVRFALFVFGFIVAASWTMARMVLDGPEGRREPGIDEAPARRQVAYGLGLTLALGVVLFVVFPRLSWNQAMARAPPGLGGVTGMSESVRLGGGGDIKTNPRVVFRVSLDPDPLTESLEAYWVGRHFTRFDGRQWSSTGTAQPPTRRVLMPFPRRRGARSVKQDIVLSSAYGSRTLVALDVPMHFLNGRSVGLGGAVPMNLSRVPDDQVLAMLEGNEIGYEAISVDEPSFDTSAPPASATELPALDPRVRALAVELKGPAKAPLDVATRFERELTRRYAYTLALPGEVDDPLVDFLFVRRAGHCEDFATALAVLLRIEGIPSRVTTGFLGGQRAGARYHVRAGDAHAWTEAYVDGAWRRFDATPEAGRSASPPAWLSAAIVAYETVEEWWRLRVLDYSVRDQFAFVRDVLRWPSGTDEAGEARGASLTPTGRGALVVSLATVALLALLFLPRRRGRGTHPASGLLDAIEATLRARGVDTGGKPLEEFSQSLTATNHPLGPALAHVTRRYLEARFGARPLGPREQRALLATLETPPGPSAG